MAKITIELGATLNTGEYSNVRPLVRIHDIDPDLDVAGQVEGALRAAVEAFPLVDERLASIAEELVTGTPGRDGLRERIERMEAKLGSNTANVKVVFDKVKNEVLPQLAALQEQAGAVKRGGKAKRGEEAADGGEG